MKVLIVEKNDEGLAAISAHINTARFTILHALGIDEAFLTLQRFEEPLAIIINIDDLGEESVVLSELIRNTSISITPYIIGYSQQQSNAMSDIISDAIDDHIYAQSSYELLNYRLKVAERIISVQKDLMSSIADRNEAIEQLSMANLRRQQMYSIVAHELRTPVELIDMMNRSDSSTELESQRNMIKDATDALFNTIDDMKMLVNPTQQRNIRVVNVSIKEINQSIFEKSLVLAQTYNMSLKEYHFIREFKPEQRIRIDMYRVFVALSNLIKNSCFHSQGTSIELISRIREIDGKLYICWSVSDDGVGMSDNFQTIMLNLQTFYQQHNDTSGMGLFIVKNMVEEINGNLVYRALPNGCLFEIQIPLSLSDDISTMKDKRATTQYQYAFHNMNVLFIDEDNLVCKFAKSLLKNVTQGIDIITEPDAVFKTNLSQYDLVLIDELFPKAEKSATTVIKAMREVGFKGKIICIVAKASGAKEHQFLNCGADGTVLKPIGLAHLDAAITSQQVAV